MNGIMQQTCSMHSYMIVSSKLGIIRINISIYTKTLEKYGGIRPLPTLNIKHATCNLCNESICDFLISE